MVTINEPGAFDVENYGGLPRLAVFRNIPREREARLDLQRLEELHAPAKRPGHPELL